MSDVHQGLVHQQLMAHARDVRAASDAGDRDGVTRTSAVLLADLAIHLDDERLRIAEVDLADPELATALRENRRAVVDLLIELADEPVAGDDACRCRELADGIVELLEEEVATEVAAGNRPASPED